MRFKYYLRGLGLGIIFTVVVLALTGRLSNGSKEEAYNREAGNDSQINILGGTEADNPYGYGKETVTETFYPAEDRKKSTENDSDTENSDGVDGLSGPDNDPANKKDSKTSKKDDNTKDSDSSKDEDSVELIIKKGQYCWSVSEELQKLGVIDSARDFRKYMDRNGYIDAIKTGTYRIPKKATFEEIAKILIK